MKLIAFLLFIVFVNAVSGQTIASARDSVMATVTVKVMDENAMALNYELIIRCGDSLYKMEIINKSYVGFWLELGKRYSFQIVKTGYTEPEYTWDFMDSKVDFRRINFLLYPEELSERQRNKLKRDNLKEDSRANGGIKRTCTGLDFRQTVIIE